MKTQIWENMAEKSITVHNNKFEMYLLLNQKNISIINSTQMTLSPATFPGNCQSPENNLPDTKPQFCFLLIKH